MTYYTIVQFSNNSSLSEITLDSVVLYIKQILLFINSEILLGFSLERQLKNEKEKENNYCFLEPLFIYLFRLMKTIFDLNFFKIYS